MIVSYGSGRFRPLTGSLPRVMRQESKKMKPATLKKKYRQMNRCVRHTLKKYGAEYQQTASGQFRSTGDLRIRQEIGPGLKPVVRSNLAMTRYQESCLSAGDAG